VHFIDDRAFPGGKGRALEAADFVYSIKRHFDPETRAQGAWLWQGRIVGLDDWKEDGADYEQEVPGLRAVDARTIQIQLISPYPQLPHTLAQGFAAIVPREAVEIYGREFAVRPVGSGPYRLAEFDSTRAVLSRNSHFRKEPFDLAAEGFDAQEQSGLGFERLEGRFPPFTDRIEVEFIAEDAARWNAFIAGELDFVKVPVSQFDQVLQTRDPPALRPDLANRFHLAANLESGFVHTDFNMDDRRIGYHPDPDQDARNRALRCAIIKAFDWPARNESFYADIAEVFPGIIVPAVPEFDPELSRESVTRDVEGARRLLAENGWTPENLPQFVYGTTAGVISRLMFEQFRAWLREIGYPTEKVVLKQYATFGDISKAWKQSELPWIAKGWGLDYPDAQNTLQLFYGPNGSPGSNDANWRNPEYDRMYEQASVMLPSPERTELYRAMNQLVIDDCVSATGLSRVRIHLWHKDVIALPDREIVGGFFLKYVDLED
jgi:ABC-type transport system substrate-binding protein